MFFTIINKKKIDGLHCTRAEYVQIPVKLLYTLYVASSATLLSNTTADVATYNFITRHAIVL